MVRSSIKFVELIDQLNDHQLLKKAFLIDLVTINNFSLPIHQ